MPTINGFYVTNNTHPDKHKYNSSYDSSKNANSGSISGSIDTSDVNDQNKSCVDLVSNASVHSDTDKNNISDDNINNVNNKHHNSRLTATTSELSGGLPTS